MSIVIFPPSNENNNNMHSINEFLKSCGIFLPNIPSQAERIDF